MASTSLKTMSLAVPLAGAALLPDEAEACSPSPCGYVDAWTGIEPLNPNAIPIDGVLLLRATQDGGAQEDELLAKLELTVTRDGQPIAGAFEQTDVRGVLAWRPAEPLVPGATYKATGALDNPELESYADYCAPDLIAIDVEFHADLGPSAPLTSPELAVEESVQVVPGEGIDDLVCCDDAFPYEYYFDCGGSGDHVGWGQGFCAALHGTGLLHVELSVTSDLPLSTAALVSQQLLVDGQPRPAELLLGTDWVAGRPEPFCTEIVLRNLATGETTSSGKQCHGDAVADQLGPRQLDPSAELAEKCSGGAYVCEINASDDGWDPENCTPWPGDAPPTDDPTGGPATSSDDGGSDPDSGGQNDGLVDHGCTCDAGTRGSFEALGLFALGLLRRRRRTRRAR